MRYLLLPFFLIRLLLVIFPSLVRLTIPQLPPVAPIFLSLLLLVVVTTQQLPSLKLRFQSQTPAVLSAQTEVSPMASDAGLETTTDTELYHWLNLYAQQPTHRDVLLNIALLYQAQGKTDEAQKFYHLAKEVDPNNPLIDQLFFPQKPL